MIPEQKDTTEILKREPESQCLKAKEVKMLEQEKDKWIENLAKDKRFWQIIVKWCKQDENLAEEVLVSTLKKIRYNLDQLQDTRRFNHWATVIAKREFLQLLRSRRKHPQFLEEKTKSIAVKDDTASNLDYEDLCYLLLSSLEKPGFFTEAEKTFAEEYIYHICDGRDADIPEIAKACGISEDYAYVLLYKIRNKWETYLNTKGYEITRKRKNNKGKEDAR